MVLAPWQSGAVISNQEFPKSSQVAQFANVQQPVNLTKEKWQLLVTIKGMSHYKHCWHCCTVALLHCRTVALSTLLSKEENLRSNFFAVT